MTKCLIQRVGAVISEREKNNHLKETTATSEYTWLLLMRTRCLLQSCLNWSILFVEIGSTPGEFFHLLWTTVCKSFTRFSHYLPIPESSTLLVNHFFPSLYPPLPKFSRPNLSPQDLKISMVMLRARVCIGFHQSRQRNEDISVKSWSL